MLPPAAPAHVLARAAGPVDPRCRRIRQSRSIIGFAIVAATGNIYSGLWYPVIVAAATIVLGLLLPETFRRDVGG